MQGEHITIEFQPVPEGTEWEVLIQHEVRTLYDPHGLVTEKSNSLGLTWTRP